MPHTKLIYHIVFGTKYRRKVLTKDKRTELFKFIWGILRKKKMSFILYEWRERPYLYFDKYADDNGYCELGERYKSGITFMD